MGTEYRMPASEDIAADPEWRQSTDARPIIATAYVRKFIALAVEFDEFGTMGGDALAHHRLRESAGKLVIAAVHDGFLADVPRLAERVEWHCADSSADPIPGHGGPAAVYGRRPANLFSELVGGNMVRINMDRDGKTTSVEPLGDGILPSICPAVFAHLTPIDRSGNNAERALAKVQIEAEALRFLADRVKDSGNADSEPIGDGHVCSPGEAARLFSLSTDRLSQVAREAGINRESKPGRGAAPYTILQLRIVARHLADGSSNNKTKQLARSVLSRTRDAK